jgi:folylpolyglutamate synthase/dihydropteroate synthase
MCSVEHLQGRNVYARSEITNEQFTSFFLTDKNGCCVSIVLNGGHNEHATKQLLQAPNTHYDSRIKVQSVVSISLISKSIGLEPNQWLSSEEASEQQ